jgi:dienelactone hydrolase
MRAVLAVLALLLLVPSIAAAQQPFDPAYEAKNFSKTNERAAIHSTPEYKLLLAKVSIANGIDAARIAAADPERSFVGQTVCWEYGEGCAGDARLYDWVPKDYGQVQPVVFGARNGATLSGRVWFTRAGPAKRPGIVIVNGSVQAPETLYWFVAQTLAKAGYVVLTFDPQNQGRSDSQGEAPDQAEGFPAQSDGRPFYDGAQDAIDFFLSTPSAPYRPRPSCNSGTSHAAKQVRRAAQGLNAAYNPLWNMIDTARIGIAGHSYGAAGVSYVGQRDPRVKAVVAWDALGLPQPGGVRASGIGPCLDAAERAPAAITKPALNLTADYFIPPTPNTSQPDYEAKAAISKDYSAANVDTGSIAIRGGTHYEFSWLPDPAFGATLRGADLTTWYTTAWFDAYVTGDASAQRRLRTDRWRNDAPSAAVDPDGDPNMMSRYYRSRLDIGRGGERFVCEDLRAGCPGLAADDGVGKAYDYLSIVTTPDSAPAAGGAGAPSCVAATAVRGAAARPRGRGVRFSVRPRTTVEVFRQTLRGRITRQRLVARFPRRARDFTWNGRATLRGRRVLAGAVYSARFRGSGGAVKHVTLLRRAGGRFARRGTFRTIAGCGTIRDATLARPVFGGRGLKPLDVRFRLNTGARVAVTVRRGKRVVRRYRARSHSPGRTIRLRLPARGRARGAYRVTIVARPVGAPPQAIRLTALRR